MLTRRALLDKDRRRFPEALQKLEQILNIAPDDSDFTGEKGAIAQAEGDVPRVATLLASLQPAADDTNALETQASQAILQREVDQVLNIIPDDVRTLACKVRMAPALGDWRELPCCSLHCIKMQTVQCYKQRRLRYRRMLREASEVRSYCQAQAAQIGFSA